MVTHGLAEQAGPMYTTSCGKAVKSTRGKPDNLTAWNSRTTCPLCATVAVVHQKVTTQEQMSLLIDLDDPEVAKRFSFGGKRFGFRWLIGGRLIYVYNARDAFSPMLAIHLPYGTEPSYEAAQAAARDWIIKHGDAHGETTHTKKAPLVKPTPTGPHCDTCKKPDEGDCMPSPDDMTKLRCMVCLVKKGRK